MGLNRRLFNVEIQWERCTGEDEATGEKTYDDAVAVMARVDPFGAGPSSQFTDDRPRRMIFVLAEARDGSAVAIKSSDRITLPEGQQPPLVPPIKYANPFYDSRNVLSHFEVLS